jgi:hypothetical protein
MYALHWSAFAISLRAARGDIYWLSGLDAAGIGVKSRRMDVDADGRAPGKASLLWNPQIVYNRLPEDYLQLLSIHYLLPQFTTLPTLNTRTMALVHPTVSFRIQNEFENDSITIKNVKIQRKFLPFPLVGADAYV